MKSLSAFSKLNAEKTIIVCGCGESLNDLTQPERFITIGVNDVGRKFQPNYLVVVNPKNQFSGDRFKYVQNFKSRISFYAVGFAGQTSEHRQIQTRHFRRD